RRSSDLDPSAPGLVLFGGSRAWSLAQQLVETGLVEHRNTQLLGLRELRAGLGPSDQIVRILGHAAGGLSAAGLDGLLRAAAVEVLQRARDNDAQPGQQVSLNRTGGVGGR